MENISNVLFWISNGLLVPVIVGLLYFFIRALFLLGGVYGEYLERKKTERDLNEKLENMAWSDSGIDGYFNPYGTGLGGAFHRGCGIDGL